MRFSAYSALNGACSTAIGLAFIVAGFPGLFTDAAGYWWVAIPGILVVLVPLAIIAARHGIPVGAPGRWLTDGPLARAGTAQTVLDGPRLQRRLIIETVLWLVLALAVIVGFTSSRPFAYATGWASLAYGLLELLGSAAAIRAAEQQNGLRYFVHRRPGVGTPELTTG